MESAVYVLLGTLLGGAITLVGTLIQQREQSNRERIKIALEMAKVDYQIRKEYAKPGDNLIPFENHLIYHIRLMDLLRQKKLTKERLKEIRMKQFDLDNDTFNY